MAVRRFTSGRLVTRIFVAFGPLFRRFEIGPVNPRTVLANMDDQVFESVVILELLGPSQTHQEEKSTLLDQLQLLLRRKLGIGQDGHALDPDRQLETVQHLTKQRIRTLMVWSNGASAQ